MVSDFRNRELEEEYPVLWIDALYERVREGNRVISKAVMVVKAINMDGKPDILAIEPIKNESMCSVFVTETTMSCRNPCRYTSWN